MDSAKAAEVLRSEEQKRRKASRNWLQQAKRGIITSESACNLLTELHTETADSMGLGAQALEALHWWFNEDHEPERELVRIRREEAGVKWTSDQWIAAVLDAMEKEKANGPK